MQGITPTLQKKHIAVISSVALLLFLPAFILGAGGYDLHCQSLWVKHFSTQFWDGELYPRWLMDMYAGNGSPVFFYYPPFAYYLSALFYKVLPTDNFHYLPMAASACIATAVSGITFFLWMRQETSDEAALLGGLVYMSLPWHVGFTFYDTLLYSTLWAYAWLPLLMLSARCGAEGKSYGVYAFALSLCLMIITNIPATVICAPLAVFYGAYYSDRKNIHRIMLKGFIAILLGFGLAAFFLLPSLAYVNYAMVSLHWQNIPLHLFRLDPGRGAQLTCNVFWLFQAVAICIYYAITRNSPGRLRSFFLIVSLIILLMTAGISQWLWQHIFILRVLQEPDRLFMLTTLAISVFAAIAASHHKTGTTIWITICILLVFITITGTRVTEKKILDATPDEYARYQLGIDQYHIYLGYPELIERYYGKDSLPRLKEDTGQAVITQGDAKAQVTEWKPRHIAFDYSAGNDSTVRIHQSFFPGWQALLANQPLPTAWDQESGQITIKLPPGAGKVELALTSLLPELLGKLVSLLSAGIVLVLFLMDTQTRKAKAHPVTR